MKAGGLIVGVNGLQSLQVGKNAVGNGRFVEVEHEQLKISRHVVASLGKLKLIEHEVDAERVNLVPAKRDQPWGVGEGRVV